MNDVTPILIGIDDFISRTQTYYERARTGERFVVAIEGAPKYELFSDVRRARNVLDAVPPPRPALTVTEYQGLVDLLDPLD